MATACIDGNEAAARVAYACSEVVAIYPIAPASPMDELAEAWSSAGRTNVWGTVPRITQLQSEGGAAGAPHGALQKGALATTFTASQGLLLMLPNMLKIAGELTPAVIHVAARSVATHALSIFGDHSDVMAARATGWALLASGSVQEAQDLAAVAHAATLRSRVPFLHFFDGFRTSHELNRIDTVDDDLRALIDEDDVLAHHARGLTAEHPVLRGSAQNPHVFFQAREAVNPFYEAVPDAVQAAMDGLADRTGRRYHLVGYSGHPEADRVVILMGSGLGAVRETVAELNRRGERVGVVAVRLFRPFPGDALLDALPPTIRSLAVIDRTKEPGAVGEPLFSDMAATLAEAATTGRLDPAALPRLTVVATGCRRRSSPRRWSPGCSTPCAPTHRAAAPSASPTTSPTCRSRRTATSRFRSTTATSTPSSTVSAATAPSAPTRTRSRSSASTPTCMRRATSCTTPARPARRRSRTCGSRRTPSRRRT